MAMTLHPQAYESVQRMYMALELSHQRWRVCFSDGRRSWQVAVPGGDVAALGERIEQARQRWGLRPECAVVSCYEAGRDGFWLHRWLQAHGVDNRVVDSASIEVNRRRRRCKTDGVDVKSLLRLLIRDEGGERGVWSVLRVPSEEAESRRRVVRERERLVKERAAHTNRLKSLLVTQGLRLEVGGDFEEQLKRARRWDGTGLSEEFQGELLREWRRRCQVQEQMEELEGEQRRRVEHASGLEAQQVEQLLQVKGVGWQTAWVLVAECFGWRRFANRRQVGSAAGLTPTPYQSGESEREQGISKAGNRRVRTVMIELGWRWLRYQPDSELTRWYERRWAGQGKRARRVGIVALARRLLVMLWRYLESGQLPETVRMQATR